MLDRWAACVVVRRCCRVELYARCTDARDGFDLVILESKRYPVGGRFRGVRKDQKGGSSSYFIASSGYSEDPVLSHHRDHGFAAVLKKPYGVEALERAVALASQVST